MRHLRLVIACMAFAAPAVRALSRGAAEAGCWMDTGEGGLAPHHLEGGCDVIMQIGTAKYGIRDSEGNFSPEKAKEHAKVVKAFEIKLSQGAKPGLGGMLPLRLDVLRAATEQRPPGQPE